MLGNPEDGYYADLGVSRSATTDEIKAIYRALAKIYHPDVNREPAAAATFRRIAAAYEVLSNPETRRDHDAELSENDTTTEWETGRRTLVSPAATRNYHVFACIMLVAAIGAYFLYGQASAIQDKYRQPSTVALDRDQHVVLNNARGDRLPQASPFVAANKISPSSPTTAETIDQAEARDLSEPGMRDLDRSSIKKGVGATLIKSAPRATVVQTSTAALHAGATLIKRPPPARVVQTSTAALHADATLIKWPPPARVVQTRTAAVHAGATPIKWPPPARVVQTSTAAVHAGATLIKPPPPARVVQTSTAALHAGATLIKWPPPARAVQTSTAAMHAGATPIKWPPPAKAVKTNTAAMHAGATLIKWPPAPRVVQTSTAAVHAKTLIKWPPTAVHSAKPKSPRSKASPSKFAQTREGGASTGAIPTPTVKWKTAPSYMAANARANAVKRDPASNASKATSKAGAKQRKPGTVMTAAEQRKQRTNDGMTDPKNRLRSRMEPTLAATLRAESRRMRANNRGEVKRAVGQLDEEDRRAFRSRCGQILSTPAKFAGSHVEICLTASLVGSKK